MLGFTFARYNHTFKGFVFFNFISVKNYPRKVGCKEKILRYSLSKKI